MIEFKTNVQEVLPYDREQYHIFLYDEIESSIKWYGVSFYLNTGDKDMDTMKFVEFYEPLFKNMLLSFAKEGKWIVNLDYSGQDWFPNNENTLCSLRALFKKSKIPNKYRGALIFDKDDLLEFSRELLSYPFEMFPEDGCFYSDLDVSHVELQFIIKISGYWTIDLLSTDIELLRKVVNENSSNYFNVKEYRGTSLWP